MLNDLRDTFGFKIPELFPKLTQPGGITTSCPCEFWFDGQDASTFTLNGVNVIQWDDKSGFARHLTNAVDAQRPSYNVATGRVDFVAANNDYLQSAAFGAALAQPNTIFIAYKITGALNDSEFLFDGAIANRNNAFLYSASVFKMYAAVILGSEATNANNNIHVGLFNGVSSEYWINGVSVVSGDVGNRTLDGIVLGTKQTLTNNADCEIMEVFGYNCDITDAERNALNAYLTTKWSL